MKFLEHFHFFCKDILALRGDQILFQLTLYDASLGERDEVTQNYPIVV